jgi:hypothetical protein
LEVLTRAETLKWMHSNEIAQHTNNDPLTSGLRVKFNLPRNADMCVALVLRHLEMFGTSNRLLVFLTDWGVGLTPERMEQIDKFRLNLGESRRLIDAPGHLFARQEFGSATELVALTARFEWDCQVVTRQRKRQLFFSHDGFGLASHAP